MAVSVAMCTWNGSAYVEAQLRSIVEQTRQVQEILVCDDKSADSTVDVVRRFARTCPVPVRIEVNESNLGYRLNFSRAMSLCTGDIILLADQDDVWHPTKVARMTEVFDRRPDVDLVFSDAELVHEDLSPVGYTIWQSIEFHSGRQRMVREGRFLQLLMSRNVVTGATAGIRSRIRDLVLPVPGKWVHDAWIATMVAATGTAEFVEEPLILYRQHSAQQLGGKRLTFSQRYALARRMNEPYFLDLATDFAYAKQRLESFPHMVRFPGALELIQGKVEHSRFRAAVKQNGFRYLPRVAGELLRGAYHRYSLGVFSAVQDLLL
jgi:glycosyltransferase involved in cell wall biosynthesis